MDKPFIIIDGAKIEPAEPKMKVWRAFLKASEMPPDESIEHFMDRQVELIVIGFGRPEVTKESIDDNLAISEVVPLTRALMGWIQALTFERLAQIPKVETGEDQT